MTRARVIGAAALALAGFAACPTKPPPGEPLPLRLASEPSPANVAVAICPEDQGARFHAQYLTPSSLAVFASPIAGGRHQPAARTDYPRASDEAISFQPLCGREGLVIRERSSAVAAEHDAVLAPGGDVLNLVCGYVKNQQTSWSREREVLAMTRLGCSQGCGGPAGGVAVLKRVSFEGTPRVLDDICLAQPPGPADPAFACAIEPKLHPSGSLLVWGCRKTSGGREGRLIVADFSSGTLERAGVLEMPPVDSFAFIPEREELLINRGDSSKLWGLEPPRGDERGEIARVTFGSEGLELEPLEALSRYVVSIDQLTRLGDGLTALRADVAPRFHAAIGSRRVIIVLDRRLQPIGWIRVEDGWESLAFEGGHYYGARKKRCADDADRTCFEVDQLSLRPLP